MPSTLGVALLLGCSLLATANADGDVYPSGVRAPPRVLVEAVLQDVEPEPLPVKLEAGTAIAWAAMNVFGAMVLLDYLGLRASRSEDFMIVWFHFGARVVEGIAFFLFAFSKLADSEHLNTIFLVTQVLFHCPMLWAIVSWIKNFDDPKDWLEKLTAIVPWTTLLGVATAVAGEWQGIVFMLSFEPPIISAVLVSAAFFVTALRPCCKDGRIAPLAGYLTLAQLLAYVAHLRHVGVLSGMIPETPVGLVLQTLVEASLILASTVLTIKLADIKAFTETGAPDGSPWCNVPESETVPEGRLPGFMPLEPSQPTRSRWVVSPERLWSYSFIFYFSAFAVAGFCFFVVEPPDMTQNKVLHMYGTLHPCILLDYLPGTIFAQPLFDCQIITVTLCMLGCFVRHAVQSRVGGMIVSGVIMTLFVIIGATFNLVFTLNPNRTSVLAHSIPYILMVGAQGFMMISEVMCYCLIGDLRRYPFLTLYVLVVAATCFFIQYFMTGTLMEQANWKMVSAGPVGQSTEILNLPLEQWDRLTLWRGPLTVVVLDFVFIQWYRFAPFGDTGVAFAVSARDGSQDDLADEAAAQEAPKLMMIVRISFLLRAGCISFLIALVLCVFFNLRTHGSDYFNEKPGASVEAWQLMLTTTPGAAFVSVGWVFTIIFISLHVLAKCYYECATNKAPIMRAMVVMSGSLVFVSTLFAHGGTIPGVYEKYSWYKGPQDFAFAMLTWVIVEVLLLFQHCARLNPSKVVVELTVAIVCVVSLAACMVRKEALHQKIAAVALIVFSFADANRARLYFTHFEELPLEPAHSGIMSAVRALRQKL